MSIHFNHLRDADIVNFVLHLFSHFYGPQIRDVLVSLIVLLRDAAEGRGSAGSLDSRGAVGNRTRGVQLGGVAIDKEGRRLKELCSVALQVRSHS